MQNKKSVCPYCKGEDTIVFWEFSKTKFTTNLRGEKIPIFEKLARPKCLQCRNVIGQKWLPLKREFIERIS